MKNLVKRNDWFFNPINAAFDVLYEDEDFYPRYWKNLGWVEKEDKLVKHVDLPGHEKQNINISLEGRRVRVQAKTKNDTFGERSDHLIVDLPCSSNDSEIEAEYKNGVLELRLKKPVRNSPTIKVN